MIQQEQGMNMTIKSIDEVNTPLIKQDQSIDTQTKNVIKSLKQKFQNININKSGIIKKNDVTQQDKNKLTCLTITNLYAFLIQVAGIILLSLIFSYQSYGNQINIFKLNYTFVSIKYYICLVDWVLIFLTQLLFIMVPLPCFKVGEHFKNILLYKIKWAYAIQCIFQTIACSTFTSFVNIFYEPSDPIYYPSLISFCIFLFLKLYVHIFVYIKIKYLDDGRDYVNWIEFISIHCSFSILHSTLSAYTIYNFISLIQNMLIFYDYDRLIFQLLTWCVISMLILFLEMCVYLAYYKDVIFSVITLLNFIGMYIYQRFPDIDHNSKLDISIDEQIQKCILAFITMTFLFILYTIISDYNKAFYLKYKQYFNKFNDIKNDKQEHKMTNQIENNQQQRSRSFANWLQFQIIKDDNNDMEAIFNLEQKEISNLQNSQLSQETSKQNVTDIKEEQLEFEDNLEKQTSFEIKKEDYKFQKLLNIPQKKKYTVK